MKSISLIDLISYENLLKLRLRNLKKNAFASNTKSIFYKTVKIYIPSESFTKIYPNLFNNKSDFLFQINILQQF